jgi:hypothetical protein
MTTYGDRALSREAVTPHVSSLSDRAVPSNNIYLQYNRLQKGQIFRLIL